MPNQPETVSNSPVRLVVIVPNQLLDETTFAQQIAALSIEHDTPILLLDIIESPNQQPFASIRLDTLTTLSLPLHFQCNPILPHRDIIR